MMMGMCCLLPVHTRLGPLSIPGSFTDASAADDMKDAVDAVVAPALALALGAVASV